MKMYRINLILLALLFLGFTSCKNNEQEGEVIEAEEPVVEEMEMEMDNENEEVLAAVQTNPELSTFAQALHAWNFEDTLEVKEEENITTDMIVFAPTNLAFSEVTQTEGMDMVRVDDEELIPYHIIKADGDLNTLREEIQNSNDTLVVETMQGGDLKLSLDGGTLMLTSAAGGSAKVTDSVQAGNGMVYIIDKVLLPENPKKVTISTEG